MATIHLLTNTMVRRKTMGSRLREAREALGMSRKDVQERIAKEFGVEIGETTIAQTEKGGAPNPGIKTVELIARAVYLDPLEVIAIHLDEPPPEHPEAFSRSRFAQLWKIYTQMSPARQAWYDEYLEMLIEKMKKD